MVPRTRLVVVLGGSLLSLGKKSGSGRQEGPRLQTHDSLPPPTEQRAFSGVIISRVHDLEGT